ncbi:MAG: hypothetical protein IKN54_06150 [Lachnospiraceae bacterium]|nr:hypothetical protein [Lachnospiraceae bacterium]
MNGIGSGDNGNLTFIDMLSIISFCVGLQNLDLNIAQDDLDNQTQELDRELRSVVDEIHKHLEMQDEKLDMIMKRMEG